MTSAIFSALLLTGILFLGTSLTLMNTVVAAPYVPQSQSETQLPARLANAVRQNLSSQIGIPFENLRITDYTRKTWPDGCLGLSKPDEFCTQALVEGWHITLSDGSSDWVYRTDCQGRVLRLEN
jgi:hypothetical protein